MAHILSMSYDETLLKTREMMLRSHGHDVTSALGFVSAIEFCQQKNFDLVILGHTIPPKDREQILQQLRAVCSTPILALRRPNEAPLSDAEYNLDSGHPDQFVRFVDQIVANTKRSSD